MSRLTNSQIELLMFVRGRLQDMSVCREDLERTFTALYTDLSTEADKYKSQSEALINSNDDSEQSKGWELDDIYMEYDDLADKIDDFVIGVSNMESIIDSLIHSIDRLTTK